MNEATAKRLLRTGVRRIEKMINPRAAITLKHLSEWSSGGFSGGGGDGEGRRSSDTSTPTEAAALARLSPRERDRYGADLERYVALVELIDKATLELVEITDAAEVVPTNAAGKPIFPEPEGCQPCSRITDPTTGKLHENGYQEIHTRLRLPGASEDAPLVPVCRWHCSFYDTWGVIPPEEIVLWRLGHHGDKIPRDLLRAAIPEAYDRVMRARANGKPRAFGLDRLAEDEAAQEVRA